MPPLMLPAVLCVVFVLPVTIGYTRNTFIAAVYEHAVIFPPNCTMVPTRQQALADVMTNLKIYDQQANIATSQNVDILVFPEDGLHGYQFTRRSIAPYLEEIPDPRKEVWNPCTQPRHYPSTEIQVYLSCMALNNSLYIVANMGTKQSCTDKGDPRCPSDGQYQFNTNVVYAPNGNLIARYHKQNLYFEGQFDTPQDVD